MVTVGQGIVGGRGVLGKLIDLPLHVDAVDVAGEGPSMGRGGTGLEAARAVPAEWVASRGAAVPPRVAVAHARVSLESKTPGDAAELVAGEPVSASVRERLAEGEPVEPLRAERLGMRGDGADVATTDLDVVPGDGMEEASLAVRGPDVVATRRATPVATHARRADDVQGIPQRRQDTSEEVRPGRQTVDHVVEGIAPPLTLSHRSRGANARERRSR